jgi:UDP-glucuronate 4-epimerase
MTRRALVTGGAGFIGSHLVDQLLDDGWRVDVVDNFDPFYDVALKRRNVARHLDYGAYRLHRLDIRDGERCRAALRGEYDVLVHMAAKAGVGPSLREPIAYQDVNVGGTYHVLEWARAWRIPRVVLASSSSVYGANPALPWREEGPGTMPAPISPYAATKASSELIGYTYSQLYGMQVTALRLFTVYGPRQRPDLAIHRFARQLVDGEALRLFGSGGATRDYTYVADTVMGIRAAMQRESGSAYEIVNIASGVPVALRKLVDALGAAFGVVPRVEHVPAQAGDSPHTWGDIGKARRLLGYEPAMTLADGLAAFAEWYDATRPRAVQLAG